jgi:hypothetical protein
MQEGRTLTLRILQVVQPCFDFLCHTVVVSREALRFAGGRTSSTRGAVELLASDDDDDIPDEMSHKGH